MTRIEINNILEVFRFVHMAAFSAYHHPNSFTSCCSFDSVGVEGHHMTDAIKTMPIGAINSAMKQKLFAGYLLFNDESAVLFVERTPLY